MTSKVSRREARRVELRAAWFLPYEARQLKWLASLRTPAAKDMIQARVERRQRFELIAAWKMETGRWRYQQLGKKWAANLSRMYNRMGWRVQEGPTNALPGVRKGQPNAFAMFRYFERATGGGGRKKQYGDRQIFPHGYPDWERKQIRRGKTQLDRGTLFIQQAKKAALGGHKMSREWYVSSIAALDRSIAQAKGKRRIELMHQRNRLERSL